MNPYIEQANQQFVPVYNRYPIVWDHGEGMYLYDTEGKRYLDFGSGIGVCALGYHDPNYTRALQEQMEKLLHTSNLFYNVPAIEAAKLFNQASGMEQVFFTNSGTEAIEGAIKIAEMANKVRKNPLRCILNGLGKDAAMIISRINGFTYVQTQFDYFTGELKVVNETPYSDGPRAKVKCYGADDVREGVAIMWKEGVDVSITGNSTNPTRFQHPVAGTYKKERVLAGKPYFSVASGGGTGRTLHPDNMAAGPASYGMTDTLGRMHSDAQFAGSSSVPAHVEMMGFLGIGNNPMVGCSVACAVNVDLALNKK